MPLYNIQQVFIDQMLLSLTSSFFVVLGLFDLFFSHCRNLTISCEPNDRGFLFLSLVSICWLYMITIIHSNYSSSLLGDLQYYIINVLMKCD